VLGQGEVIHARPLGFVVKQTENVPVCCRVGTILTHFSNRDEFYDACRDSSDLIQVNLC
jgi:hypothetical protein